MAHVERHHLVTGGAGFIGSHLVESLLNGGDRVTVVDDASTGCWKNLQAVVDHPGLTIERGSVADAKLVRRLVQDVDHVYHLAAAVGVQLIARSPLQTIETNIYPTELLLSELLLQFQAGRSVKLFLASSSEVYGKNPKTPWTEEDDLVLGPTSRARWSYGASKAIDEFLAFAYWRQHGLPVVIGRFFNVIGPRQIGTYGMVLPRLVDAALAGEPLVVHDDGQQTRCFANVIDVVRSVRALMAVEAAIGNVFNIGSDQPVTIAQLAAQVIAAIDTTLPIKFQSYAEAYSQDFEDVRTRVPDISKLIATIGEHSTLSLNETIHQVIAWTRNSKIQKTSEI